MAKIKTGKNVKSPKKAVADIAPKMPMMPTTGMAMQKPAFKKGGMPKKGGKC